MAWQIGETAQFASGVSLVEVYATVTDRNGQPVTGLGADAFRVEEDGRVQTIAAFASGDVPLALAVAVDRSFSMTPAQLAMATAAARELIRALRPEDEVMVVAIGSGTEVVAPLSRDRRDALTALDRLDTWGTTPIYDATLAALEVIQTARGRRALILLSDGVDRYSDASATDLIGRARQSDVLVYPVALGRSRPPVFVELASVTGGRSIAASAPKTLTAELAGIARELRSQYLLGYSPSVPSGAEPGWRSIRVSVTSSEFRVRARDGYYASAGR